MIRVVKEEQHSFQDIMDRFNLVHGQFMHMIDGWSGIGDKDVTKKEMRTFPIDNWVEISDGVWIRRRKDLPGDILVFETTMEEGSEFGMHKHSDCLETCDVLEGKMVDLKTNVCYPAGSQAIYQPGEVHVPVALRATKLMVYFK